MQPRFPGLEYRLKFVCHFYAGMSSVNRSTSFQGSPVLAGARAAKGGLISVQLSGKQSANIPNQPDSGSP